MSLSPPPFEDPDFVSHQSSAYRGLGILASATILAFVLFQSLPWLAGHMPWGLEKKISQTLLTETALIPCQGNANTQAAFQKVVQRLFPLDEEDRRIPLHIAIIRGKPINAFAFFGGNIFLYEGLLKAVESPEELAAVMAHEISHVRQRHVAERLVQSVFIYIAWNLIFFGGEGDALSQLLQNAADLKYSRSHEELADQGALDRLKRGQISVTGFQRFFSRNIGSGELGEVFSTHPSDKSRASRAAPYLSLPTRPLLTSEEWRELKGFCDQN